MEQQQVKIEDTARYEFLMEESMKQFPTACMWMVHCAVCEQILEEEGIEIDTNDVETMKNVYCSKLEYNDMITCSKFEDEEQLVSVEVTE